MTSFTYYITETSENKQTNKQSLNMESPVCDFYFEVDSH